MDKADGIADIADKGGNLFATAMQVESLAMSIGRKKMANDVMRVLVDSKNVSCAESIERVVALCTKEAAA